MSSDRCDRKKIRGDGSNKREGIKRRDVLLSGGSLLAASALSEMLITAASNPANAQASAAVFNALPSDEIGEVATSAYIYAYPLILMEMTRRVGTNVADLSRNAKAPMNQFANLPAFPDANFTDVVRPNADTLYSILWFDVSKEPLLIKVPDSGGDIICFRCLTRGPTCSNQRASARPGQAHNCLQSPNRVGRVNSLRALHSFVAQPQSAGSSYVPRPMAKLTTKP
jgi:Protein of unknown function (DUF1254)